MEKKSQIAGGLWMIAAGATFAGVNTILQHLGMNKHILSTTTVLLQYAIALFFFIPILRFDGIKNALSSQHRVLHIVRIVVSVIGIQLWTMALAKVPIWQGIALLMTSPLFATLGSILFLKEKLCIERLLACFMGFVGGIIILKPWSDDFTLYSLLPIGAAFFWASASLMTKYSVKDDNPITIVAYLLFLMLPVNLVFGYNDFILPTGLQTWIWLFYAGLLTAFAQWAIVKAYASADASFVQPFDHAKLLFNVSLGIAAFGSFFIPPGEFWIGAVLIVASISFITYKEQKNSVR